MIVGRLKEPIQICQILYYRNSATPTGRLVAIKFQHKTLPRARLVEVGITYKIDGVQPPSKKSYGVCWSKYGNEVPSAVETNSEATHSTLDNRQLRDCSQWVFGNYISI